MLLLMIVYYFAFLVVHDRSLLLLDGLVGILLLGFDVVVFHLEWAVEH
jgi:hypothetical protein